ncbi:hypothetical protein [Aestuariimicrobium ganziense]|uniref:hypothetical protein n=1 Tax=Aestuariimicrobium ganziense TaxID=2773677 RepID=UPI001944F552|nr:hypothetical protein [Aestuariimicrobium ganziense]
MSVGRMMAALMLPLVAAGLVTATAPGAAAAPGTTAAVLPAEEFAAEITGRLIMRNWGTRPIGVGRWWRRALW